MRDVNKQLLIDAARDGTVVARTILSDSSPVGLENWQLTEMYTFSDAVDIRRRV